MFMQRDFAIECKCSHRGERFQLAFAQAAMEIVPKDESTAFEPSRNGLTLLAETELSLERPLARLREVYGDALQVDSPLVRYKRGERLEEPYMGLRVLCAPQHFEAIRRDLSTRRANLLDTEVNVRFAVIRAEAPLALLVGYPAKFDSLTQGRGQLAMWLSHFAPVEDDPPGGNAA
jgi:predicted membrane GTPase involved in stress response